MGVAPHLTIGFRCLPNYGNDLRIQYNRVLSAIAASDMLSDMLTQLTGEAMTVDKLDHTIAEAVLDANYTLS